MLLTLSDKDGGGGGGGDWVVCTPYLTRMGGGTG